MKDFRSLKVWEKAHALTLTIYKSTGDFPKQELYALTNQIQRAAVSIPANIAEGCGKDTDAELKRYFSIAMGSSSELEYLLLLSCALVTYKKPHTNPCKITLSKSVKCSMHSFRSVEQPLKAKR